jgi:hypothetical protein
LQQINQFRKYKISLNDMKFKKYIPWKLVRSISCFVIILFSSSCGNSINNKNIVGKWKGIEWLINGHPSDRNAGETTFSFDNEGNYTFSSSGIFEKGSYNVENDMLFTKPEDQQEIMVRINKLTKDSLVFDMNRGGQPETLVLLRIP